MDSCKLNQEFKFDAFKLVGERGTAVALSPHDLDQHEGVAQLGAISQLIRSKSLLPKVFVFRPGLVEISVNRSRTTEKSWSCSKAKCFAVEGDKNMAATKTGVAN